ncbi:MAG: hypothetical protein KKE51_14400 [Gammaproteobacteria bacterium]|nr:hypothetical protein [Gammaproteobacteria bacterium]MBU1601899.1 hypothetical protein [Gammaproteobacteria bacterium]MBU2432271.1 hypothetical protein [Gammaproteobacteria bacterium]MBU2450336.1 hypothetical protein [Gammaproteobacteria bacterium]
MSESPLRSALLAAIHRVLSPIVRVMLAHEITLPMAIEILKRVFVEVAERDFRLENKASTDSRISLLTGVHRKDVKRLRELPDVEANLPPKISLSAQVVATWITHPQWLDENGQPRPLSRLARDAGEASFEALVASVSQDIRPRSVLDEWLRLGVVDINATDEVVLLSNAFIPREGLEEKLAYYGHNLGDHAAAAADNVLATNSPWFERSVHRGSLTEAQVEKLRARAAKLGMQTLTQLHTLAGEPDENATPSASGPGKRFTCGVYFYSTDVAETPAEK